MKDKIKNEMLKHIKEDLCCSKLSPMSALSYVNGLAKVYAKASGIEMRNNPTNELIKYMMAKFIEKGNTEMALCYFEDYISSLPYTFSNEINFDLFLQSTDSKALEDEVTRIAYRTMVNVLDSANINYELDEPSYAQYKALLSEYKISKDFYEDYKELGHEVDDEKVKDVLYAMALKAVTAHVEYGEKLSEYITNYYAKIEQERIKDDYRDIF